MSTIVFAIIAIFPLVFALAAAKNPRLMHAALSFAVMYIGIAAFFFLLGAEFVGLVQIFVYVGAVAVLSVFTILLTRRDAEGRHGFKWAGVIVAVGVFAGLVWATLKTNSLPARPFMVKAITVKEIGATLMNQDVWPLLCVGVLLTAALIGALVLVMEEKR